MKYIFLLFITLFSITTKAQTDNDGLMMEKKYLCIGAIAGSSNWKNYWEGTFKRDNANLGTISTRSRMLMGNYGISNKLNLIFGLPYVKTNASAGQLAGQKGLQDLSLNLKWLIKERRLKKGTLKSFLIAGYSNPLTNYTPDLLPLSIGLKSRTASLRLMADYEIGDWSFTLSENFIYRGNVTLDRNTYYTTEMHYTNLVDMPNALNLHFRGGYRTKTWIAEFIVDDWTTLGGFDMSKNNMPFVSNTMNATRLGLHLKYETNFVDGLSFLGDFNHVIAGRNIGQSTGYSLGAFYIIDFKKKSVKNKK